MPSSSPGNSNPTFLPPSNAGTGAPPGSTPLPQPTSSMPAVPGSVESALSPRSRRRLAIGLVPHPSSTAAALSELEPVPLRVVNAQSVRGANAHDGDHVTTVNNNASPSEPARHIHRSTGSGSQCASSMPLRLEHSYPRSPLGRSTLVPSPSTLRSSASIDKALSRTGKVKDSSGEDESHNDLATTSSSRTHLPRSSRLVPTGLGGSTSSRDTVSGQRSVAFVIPSQGRHHTGPPSAVIDLTCDDDSGDDIGSHVEVVPRQESGRLNPNSEEKTAPRADRNSSSSRKRSLEDQDETPVASKKPRQASSVRSKSRDNVNQKPDPSVDPASDSDIANAKMPPAQSIPSTTFPWTSPAPGIHLLSAVLHAISEGLPKKERDAVIAQGPELIKSRADVNVNAVEFLVLPSHPLRLNPDNAKVLLGAIVEPDLLTPGRLQFPADIYEHVAALIVRQRLANVEVIEVTDFLQGDDWDLLEKASQALCQVIGKRWRPPLCAQLKTVVIRQSAAEALWGSEDKDKFSGLKRLGKPTSLCIDFNLRSCAEAVILPHSESQRGQDGAYTYGTSAKSRCRPELKIQVDGVQESIAALIQGAWPKINTVNFHVGDITLPSLHRGVTHRVFYSPTVEPFNGPKLLRRTAGRQKKQKVARRFEWVPTLFVPTLLAEAKRCARGEVSVLDERKDVPEAKWEIHYPSSPSDMAADFRRSEELLARIVVDRISLINAGVDEATIDDKADDNPEPKSVGRTRRSTAALALADKTASSTNRKSDSTPELKKSAGGSGSGKSKDMGREKVPDKKGKSAVSVEDKDVLEVPTRQKGGVQYVGWVDYRAHSEAEVVCPCCKSLCFVNDDGSGH